MIQLISKGQLSRWPISYSNLTWSILLYLILASGRLSLNTEIFSMLSMFVVIHVFFFIFDVIHVTWCRFGFDTLSISWWRHQVMSPFDDVINCTEVRDYTNHISSTAILRRKCTITIAQKLRGNTVLATLTSVQFDVGTLFYVDSCRKNMTFVIFRADLRYRYFLIPLS